MGDKAYIGTEIIDKNHEFNIWYCKRKFSKYQQLKHVLSFLRRHQISQDDVVFELPDKADWFERNGYVPIPEDIQNEIRTKLKDHQESLQSRL